MQKKPCDLGVLSCAVQEVATCEYPPNGGADDVAAPSDKATTDASAAGVAAECSSPPRPDVLPDAVFTAAAGAYELPVVRRWLQEGGDVNARERARGWTLLMASAVYDHSILVLELCDFATLPTSNGHGMKL